MRSINVTSPTVSLTENDTVVNCYCSTNAIAVTLPTSGNSIVTIRKKDSGANTVIISGGDETITLSYIEDYATFIGENGVYVVVDKYTATPTLNSPVITGTGTAAFSKLNAVSATNVLTISGTVLDGETVTIGDDVYEFCADSAQSLAEGSTIAVDIEAYTTKSTGTLTVSTNPTAGQTLVIGPEGHTTTYTFRALADFNAAGEVLLGATAAATQAGIIGAIMGTDGVNEPDPYVTIGEFSENAATVTAKVGGTVGDAITTTDDITGGFGGSTLGSGADASKAHGRTALVAAINASGTAGVTAAAASGDTMTLAATPGAAGNAIATTETMSHGAFSSATMVGGSNQGMTSPIFTNMTHEVTVNTHSYENGTTDWTLSPTEQLIPFHKCKLAGGAVDAIIPLTPSIPYTFINGSGQALTVKGASGTGTEIANTKTATVMSDGTNVIRLTTDA